MPTLHRQTGRMLSSSAALPVLWCFFPPDILTMASIRGKVFTVSFPKDEGENMRKGRYFGGRTMAIVGVKGIARLGLVAVLLAIGLLVAAPAAQADTFDLTSCHISGGNCPPAGTVFGTVT